MYREFNLVRLLKSIRKQKIMFAESLNDPKVRLSVQNDERNYIDLDSPRSMNSSEDSQVSDYIKEKKAEVSDNLIKGLSSLIKIHEKTAANVRANGRANLE